MMSAFRDFDRESIRRTIRYMHSGWRNLADKLPLVTVPTLLIAGLSRPRDYPDLACRG
jgi:hypothetical protein